MQHRDFLIKIILNFLCVITYAVCAHGVAEEGVTPLYEQKIKAGLVYNLIKYTEWPKLTSTSSSQAKGIENSNVLKICLFGEDPFDGYLTPLQGRTAQQAIITIAHVASISEATSCNAIIIHRSQQHQLHALLEFLRGKNILTISDIENFAERGGMVELTRQKEKIALHINKKSVDRAALAIDGRMLKLATIVTSEGGG